MKYFRQFNLVIFCILTLVNFSHAETPKTLYDQIKEFKLNGGKADVSSLVLKRDRVEMTFNGTFYFSSPINGKVLGAVFIGQGNFKAEIPNNEFEKENVKRLLDTDTVDSTFETAVLRFTDDTFDVIGKNLSTEAAANSQAIELAEKFEPRFLQEFGANLSSRLAGSILNEEKEGFFFAQFDGGKRDRFNYVLDHQSRIPTVHFGINGGEKGLVYRYIPKKNNAETWLAFYSAKDYENNFVSYSDMHDLVDITHYKMDLDLTDPKDKLGLKAKISMKTNSPKMSAVTFSIGESLGERFDQRLNKQMRLKKVLMEGKELDFVQEDWESSLTVFLPESMEAGKEFDLDFELEGDFLRQGLRVANSHYPRSNTSWYPRHGYLDRATFDVSFTHDDDIKVACAGVRQSEETDKESKTMTTKYKMDHPVSFITFALGPFKRHRQMVKFETGGDPLPIEFNSVPFVDIKESFILAELNNSVRFFDKLFGKYPYETYGATYHPYGFGQGLPSMLMIPDTDQANKYTYSFIAHETAHQWWGNIVAWRSYRDQWLSEGFAEYSGVLYTSLRDDPKAAKNLVINMREAIEENPRNRIGVGKGSVNDIGPLILGHRLNTRKSFGAYNVLIYNKGGLVLRMLHFLFTDPATGNGDAFFAMMKDFVERHRNKTASTEDFRQVANEHFVNTKIAKIHRISDLNWFFKQWVYETGMPSYELDYSFDKQSDGSVIMNGTITQKDVPSNWAMVLPIVFDFGGKSKGGISVLAYGEKRDFKIKLPTKPKDVELDPDKWILSDKTKTN